MTDTASTACSPCTAIVFLLGLFGGYIGTTLLNSAAAAAAEAEAEAEAEVDHCKDRKSESSQKERRQQEVPVVSVAAVEYDDGGNAVMASEYTSGERRGGDQTSAAAAAASTCTGSSCSSTISSIAAAATATAPATSEHGAVKLVLQRFNRASLLLSSDNIVRIATDGCGGCGLLVYVSFSNQAAATRAATTTASTIYRAAKMVCNAPVLTRGVWGDGSGTVSVLDLATELDRRGRAPGSGGSGNGNGNGNSKATSRGVPIVLVPQANLISKMKNSGKSIQYHGQVKKHLGRGSFHMFVRAVELVTMERQARTRGEKISEALRTAIEKVGGTLSDSSNNNKAPGSGAGGSAPSIDPSVPPRQMFRDSDIYESWDDDGLPLTKVGGVPLTKSALKKMKKQLTAQKKRYHKYVKSGNKPSATRTQDILPSAADTPSLRGDPQFVNVVSGTFGNLQALDFSSDCGPFCHLVDVE